MQKCPSKIKESFAGTYLPIFLQILSKLYNLIVSGNIYSIKTYHIKLASIFILKRLFKRNRFFLLNEDKFKVMYDMKHNPTKKSFVYFYKKIVKAIVD